jgi:hypothetical protein
MELQHRTQTQHTRSDSSGGVISPKMNAVSDNTQHSHERIFMPSMGFETPSPAIEQPQTHVLDHEGTRIGTSLTHLLHLAMEQYHKEQEGENKLAIILVK